MGEVRNASNRPPVRAPLPWRPAPAPDQCASGHRSVHSDQAVSWSKHFPASLESLAEDVGPLADAEPQMVLVAEGRSGREHHAVFGRQLVGQRERAIGRSYLSSASRPPRGGVQETKVGALGRSIACRREVRLR